MKKRILALVLLATLAITGCGSEKPNAEVDKFAEEIHVNQDGTVFQTEAEVTSSAVPTEALGDGPAAEQSADPTETPEEKYYLTFEAVTTEGEAWNSDKFTNSKITMINVWGTYCNPCLSEMPGLGELAAEYDAGQFQLIGVICDVMSDDSAANIDYAKQLIAETKANYPHLLLNESLYASFVGAVSAVPTTFFVRQDGSVIGYLTGAMEKENWKTLIDELLSKEQ